MNSLPTALGAALATEHRNDLREAACEARQLRTARRARRSRRTSTAR